MQTHQTKHTSGYQPTSIDSILQDAAVNRFVREYGWFMLQYAVYDESAGRYVMGLEQ